MQRGQQLSRKGSSKLGNRENNMSFEGGSLARIAAVRTDVRGRGGHEQTSKLWVCFNGFSHG
jgi:hypothetical protein